jgi:hypothetical protein
VFAEPAGHGGGYGRRITQGVIAGDLLDLAGRAFGGHAEWVVLALDHEHRDAYRVELVEAALAGVAALAGRVDGESQA